MAKGLKIALVVIISIVSVITIMALTTQIRYPVERVIDGDTIVINYWGRDTKVRLIGVNAPESVSPDESKNCAEGRAASKFTKKFIGSSKVRIAFDNTRKDKYGRMLAYVYVNGVQLNMTLVKTGHAEAMEVGENMKYANEYYDAMLDAQAAGVGMWR